MRRRIPKLVDQELFTDALSLYTKLHGSSRSLPTFFAFPPLLKACGKLGYSVLARQLHARIVKSGFSCHAHTATALTDVYMKLRLLHCAIKVFEETPTRTLPLCNVIICGLSQNGCSKRSLQAFRCLEAEGMRPSSVTFAGVLPACRCVEEGAQLHGCLLKVGYEADAYTATAVVTMYLKCRELDSARRFFSWMFARNHVTYNAMIAGLVHNGCSKEARDVFREMMFSSKENPNSSTLLSVLSACSDCLALICGKMVHAYLLKHDDLAIDAMIGTTLVDMYSKCGDWESAYWVFARLGKRNLVTWNAMISGLLSHGKSESALKLFQQLELGGLIPDMATWNMMINGFSTEGNGPEAIALFRRMQLARVHYPSLKVMTSLLEACSSLSSYLHGKEVHCNVLRNLSDIKDDDMFNTTLVHFYMKCGFPILASRVFNMTSKVSRDPAIWNAMISGYGRNGDPDSAFGIFLQMQEEKLELNSITFLCILMAFSHAGQVERGLEIFRSMSRDFGLNPNNKHFSCVVDLLGRAGRLNEAWCLLQEVRSPSESMYLSLLGACKEYHDVELSALAAEQLSEFQPPFATTSVVQSGIYADQGRWGDAKMTRNTLDRSGVKKDFGYSWIDAI